MKSCKTVCDNSVFFWAEFLFLGAITVLNASFSVDSGNIYIWANNFLFIHYVTFSLWQLNLYFLLLCIYHLHMHEKLRVNTFQKAETPHFCHTIKSKQHLDIFENP